MSKRRRSLLGTGRRSGSRADGVQPEPMPPKAEDRLDEDTPNVQVPPVEVAGTIDPPPAREAADVDEAPPAPVRGDEDAAFFRKAPDSLNPVADKPLDSTLPKQFETNDDDWYVRTGQPAPERAAEVYVAEAEAQAIESTEPSPSEGRVLVWLPALAMVTFVLFAAAVLALILMAV